MTISIGYKASSEQFAPRDLLEFSVDADQRGFDSIMVADHLQPWRHTGGHAPYSLSWLGALGERTSHARLGTSVLTPTFRNSPAIVAHAFATLGSLYPDRMILGVGTGEALNEVSVTGVEWPAFKERFARLREAITMIRTLWSEERVSFEGEYYQTKDVTIYDRPEHQVPIYVAAGGPMMAKYAGRMGDGMICTSGKGVELYTEKLLPATAEGEAAAGRPTPTVDRMIEIKLSFDLDPERALEDCRWWAPLALTAEQKHGLDDPAEMEKAGDELPIEQVAKRWIVASDPDEAFSEIKNYADMGFNHLVFHGAAADQHRFLAQFDEHLMPRLRAL